MRFRAIVVIGNRKGKVGLGTGKANEVQVAVQKATKAAKRAMIKVPLTKGTIPHDVDVKFKAAKLRLMPASEGTGIIAGGPLRVILDHAGVRNVLAKRFGTKNTLVNAQAGILALKSVKPLKAEHQEAEDKANAPKETMVVQNVSKDQIVEGGLTVKKEEKKS